MLREYRYETAPPSDSVVAYDPVTKRWTVPRPRRQKRTRDAFGFIATGIGAVAIWVVFVNWIL
jgi:hypothetical protein